MEMVPVHLPETMVEDLDRVAKRGGLDRSTALRRLPRAGLERHVDEPCGRGELSRREAAAWMGVDVREAMGRLGLISASQATSRWRRLRRPST